MVKLMVLLLMVKLMLLLMCYLQMLMMLLCCCCVAAAVVVHMQGYFTQLILSTVIFQHVYIQSLFDVVSQVKHLTVFSSQLSPVGMLACPANQMPEMAVQVQAVQTCCSCRSLAMQAM